MNGDADLGTEPGQGLVDRVVDDFIDQMMEAGRSCRPDVHRRPLTNGFEPFEDLDALGAVIRRGSAVTRCLFNL
jgi:hypothetical protein